MNTSKKPMNFVLMEPMEISIGIMVSSIANLFFKEVVRLHDLPKIIVSNRDSKILWTKPNTKLLFSTTCHPQVDGQTKVTNRTLSQLLRCFVGKSLKFWEEWLPHIKFVYNMVVNTTISYSSFELICMLKLVLTLRKMLNNMLTGLTRKGDIVWVYLKKERFPTLRKSKLLLRGDGPFKVIRKIIYNTYILDIPQTYEVNHTFHVTNLSAFDKKNSFQEGEPDVIMTNLEEEPQASKEDKEIIDTQALQGPMREGRLKKLQEKVLQKISLLKSLEKPSPSSSPTIYFVWIRRPWLAGFLGYLFFYPSPFFLTLLSMSNLDKLHVYDPEIDSIFHRLIRSPRSSEVANSRLNSSVFAYDSTNSAFASDHTNNANFVSHLANSSSSSDSDFGVGISNLDTHKHLKKFNVVCSTTRPLGIREDYIKMKAFPFSLDGATNC
ncbi:hypothetical protein CR513_48318, partial [Mucuna pruriens]